jgi:hypothetical protein
VRALEEPQAEQVQLAIKEYKQQWQAEANRIMDSLDTSKFKCHTPLTIDVQA